MIVCNDCGHPHECLKENSGHFVQLLERMVESSKRLSVFNPLYQMYVGSRLIGHTTLMLEGVRHWTDKNRRPLVIIDSDRQRDYFVNDTEFADFITIDQIVNMRGMGLRQPIAIDNYVVLRLVSLVAKIEGELRQLRKMLERR